MQIGSAAEWVAGLGAFTASFVALRGARNAAHMAREDRRSRVREHRVEKLAELLNAVAADRDRSRGMYARSPEGQAACWALWRARGSFGTAWAYYCEDDQAWIEALGSRGELWQRMQQEIATAIDLLEFDDEQSDPPKRRLLDRSLAKMGLQRVTT